MKIGAAIGLGGVVIVSLMTSHYTTIVSTRCLNIVDAKAAITSYQQRAAQAELTGTAKRLMGLR